MLTHLTIYLSFNALTVRVLESSEFVKLHSVTVNANSTTLDLLQMPLQSVLLLQKLTLRLRSPRLSFQNLLKPHEEF